MATSATTSLSVEQREPAGSRAARRLRREGKVLGVLYGGGEDPVAFQVDARVLRQVLSHAGAVLDLSVGDAGSTPVVIKELARHPVTGRTLHLDLLRVRLDVAIQATVVVELVGGDNSPGAKEGGVLEQITREVTIEALPTDIPDSLHYDASEMVIGDTVALEAITAPPGVKLEDEAEIEEETELVAEGEAAPEGEAGEGDGGEGSGEGDSGGE